MKTYQPVIGLEIHVELKTESGIFCQCKVNQFDAKPNTHVCPVCLGLPGALPVPNKKAIEWTIKIGHALNCTINKHTKFDRKHYSYPDLPKGYQISQYDEPIAINGLLKLKCQMTNDKSTNQKAEGIYEEKVFRIHRVHLEEDTGKLTHSGEDTLVDFNRSGTPLVEIVTEPDFTSSDDVKMFLEELHTIIRYLDVSDADMEKGTMRMEPNISVRVMTNDKLPNYKVEVKNINSFNFVKRAIDYEVKRHIELLEQGKTPVQETRGWDSSKNITYSQRSKEEAHDYRYFPEPDIPPFEFTDEYIESIRKTLPELPQVKMLRFIEEDKVKPVDAYILTRNKELANFYEGVLKEFLQINQVTKATINLKSEPKFQGQIVANYIINKKPLINQSFKQIAQTIYDSNTTKTIDIKILLPVIMEVINANPKVVADYKSGKQNAIMFLVGQVMREMKGKADANTVIAKLKDMLK